MVVNLQLRQLLQVDLAVVDQVALIHSLELTEQLDKEHAEAMAVLLLPMGRAVVEVVLQ